MSEPLDDWITELATALDVDPAVLDRDQVLDFSRTAHTISRSPGVSRGAVPLTVFLVGLAAGLHGGGADAIAAATGTARSLAAARTG
jgi:hypothetical protein